MDPQCGYGKFVAEACTLIKKLTVHGNSAALIIDKALLEVLHIDMDTPLSISTDGESLVISPLHDAPKTRRFASVLAEVNADHGDVLRKLAE